MVQKKAYNHTISRSLSLLEQCCSKFKRVADNKIVLWWLHRQKSLGSVNVGPRSHFLIVPTYPTTSKTFWRKSYLNYKQTGWMLIQKPVSSPRKFFGNEQRVASITAYCSPKKWNARMPLIPTQEAGPQLPSYCKILLSFRKTVLFIHSRWKINKQTIWSIVKHSFTRESKKQTKRKKKKIFPEDSW